MSREREDIDRAIDIAASLEGGSAAAGPDVDLVRRSLAGGDAVPDLPERLLRRVVDSYPRREGVFDVVLSYVQGALRVLSVATDMQLTGPAGAVAVRNEGSRALPFVSMSRKFNRALLSVVVEGGGEAGCTFTVQAADAETRVPLAQSRVELVSGWRELASAPLVDGRALFEEVRPGRYELVVRKNEAVLGMMTIHIVP